MTTNNPYIDHAADLYAQIASGAVALPVGPPEKSLQQLQAERNWQLAAERNRREEMKRIEAARERQAAFVAERARVREEELRQLAITEKAAFKEKMWAKCSVVGYTRADFEHAFPDMWEREKLNRLNEDELRLRQLPASQLF